VHTINEFSSLMVLTNEKSSSIIALQNLIKAKKPSPQRISRFCGLITDILLADTYIIAALVAFVNIKF
jgi:hypothetical protein